MQKKKSAVYPAKKERSPPPCILNIDTKKKIFNLLRSSVTREPLKKHKKFIQKTDEDSLTFTSFLIIMALTIMNYSWRSNFFFC
jgi:hypothetical protein